VTVASNRPSLLYLSPVVPSAGGCGIAMRAGIVLEALCESHRVSLVVIPLQSAPETQVPEFLQRLCENTAILPPGESTADLIPQIAGNGHGFETIHVFRLAAMAYLHDYLRQVHGHGRLHLDLDDIESKTNRRIAELYRRVGNDAMGDRTLASAQTALLMEAVAFRLFDRVYVCSEGDRLELSDRSRGKIRVLPNAVRLPEAVRPPSPRDVFHFLFVGTLSYYPNQDGLRFFCTEVLPILREGARRPFQVTVVGSGESAGMRDLASGEVYLAGQVSNLRPWYEECQAVVVPIRGGGGTRIKILEAFSFRRPVVTTTLGVEGIEAEDYRDVLVADSPEDFAAACLKLMSDPALGQALAANGRALVLRSYTSEALRTPLS